MNAEFIAMLDYLERERGIKREILLEAVSNALLSASKKSVSASRELRIDINPKTGDLWDAEFGPRGGDEVNVIHPGKDYGWPTITYGIEYSGQPIGDAIQQKTGLEQPVYYWDPVISPSGITFYKGDRIPEWKNNLFIGALSGEHIARLVIQNNKVVGEERLLEDEGQRFRDITQGTDNALYAITDAGRLYRIDKE
jgi:glucose/arabinose dehydrogenase